MDRDHRTRPRARAAKVPEPVAPVPSLTSPRGETFEVLGRAGPVRIETIPYIPTEAREDLLVLKDAGLYVCARPDGEIVPARVSGEGLYAHDTRFLSEFRLELGGTTPVALSYTNPSGYGAVVDATNTTLLDADGRLDVPQQTLGLRRELLVADRLYHQLRLRSFVAHRVVTTLTLSLAADFADVFEVREASPRRSRRGHALAARRLDRGLVLAYVGEDDVFRETIVEFAPQPVHVELNAERALATWDVALDPREDMDVLITVEPSIGGQRRPRRRLGTAAQGRHEAYAAWRTESTRVESDNELFNRVVEASTRDLRMLLTPAPGGDLPAAGIPWYVAPFGRDSLLASGEALALNPDLARRTLRVLAGLRARTDDAWRDAEPGKILHELRDGELARAGIVPHTPYYGTVDATPLFLYLAAEYHRWTDDVETLTELRPALDAALQWMDEHGDRDGDGFLEYERRSPAGLRNQGWKDSDDCIVHADGSLAEGPIALVEVQGYAYQAKLGAADVYEALGEGDRAWELRRQAQTLREAFNYAFWDPDEGSFALALDGAKRQVRSVTSNPAHCLACGIVDADKAGPLVERLMAPDMFTGWGIRTLSGDSPAFNPMSYHNGSIWPHDNAIAAAGLKRYGFHDATLRIATALFDVAAGARDYRLPELYCGFDRGMATSAVAYPVACIPQAWAAAAPFMLLQTLLGISPRAPGRALTVNSPVLPEWLGKVELRGLRVGDATVGLVFEREGATTRFSLLERSGAVEVKLSQ